MMETQFRSVCLLNRLMVVLLAGLTIIHFWGHHDWKSQMVLGSLVVLHFGMLMGNEFILKILKRFREAELQTITHLSIFLPTALALYISCNALATGSFLVYFMGIFAILESHFLGQARLSKILGILYVGLLLMMLPLGLLPPITLTMSQVLLFSAVLGGSLYFYSSLVSQLVRSQSSEVGKLQSMAATDALTGLTNRRQFNSRLHEEVARVRRHETPLSLALFDLDDFKRLNDFYGHPMGDRILKELGKLVRQNIRESDLPARYGGEEFAIILPETAELEAYELLERIRLLVAQTVFCLPENPLTISISVGVAQLEARQHTSFELVELADKALYEAKRQGKNKVVRASSLMPKMILGKSGLGAMFKNHP
jgi:diguanylate cyclase (GGDEF)-like protein